MNLRPELLLHPNIPKPLHGLNPRTLKGKEWWDEVRQKAYAQNDYHCWACGVHKSDALFHHWLEAHENYTIDYVQGRMEITEITALCHACHNFIHSGRMIMVVDNSIPAQNMWKIFHHGFTVLKKAGLNPNPFALYAANEIRGVCSFTPEWAWSDMFDEMLKKFPVPADKIASWSKWRLILEGKEYKPLHKSQKAWAEFYQKKNDVFEGTGGHEHTPSDWSEWQNEGSDGWENAGDDWMTGAGELGAPNDFGG